MMFLCFKFCVYSFFVIENRITKLIITVFGEAMILNHLSFHRIWVRVDYLRCSRDKTLSVALRKHSQPRLRAQISELGLVMSLNERITSARPKLLFPYFSI
jgi:hypothetical protein